MSVLPVGFGSAVASGYQIERSLRFNSAVTAYLNRTPASASNRKTWTWSAWFKRGALSTNQTLFSCIFAANNNSTFHISIETDNLLKVGLSTLYVVTTSQVFRDPSAWYHIVFAFDSTQATSTNRWKLYINGSLVTAFSAAVYPNQNDDWAINAAQSHDIGRLSGYSYNYNGYMTEINFVDSPALVGSTTNASTTVTLTTGSTTNIGIGWNVGGTNIPSGATVSSITNSTQFVISSAATATGSSINIGIAPPVTAFGETDSNTGVWKPKAYTGTYGTNGFYLKFADNSNTTAATLGKDSSGNGNNWTPNGFSVTAGVNNDSMVDTPTSYGTDTGVGGEVRGNYAVYNILKLGSGGTWTVTNGNLAASNTGSGSFSIIASSIGASSGKWYFEFTATNVGGGGNLDIGVLQNWNTALSATPATSSIGQFATGYAYTSNGVVSNNNTNGSTYSSYTTNDVVQIALDLDNNKLYFGKNGTWQNSGNPAAGTGSIYTVSAGTYFAAIGRTSVSTQTGAATANFGQRAFAYTAPSGFKALCTQNFTTPTIGATSTTQADDYFNVLTYTGNGTDGRTVTGVGFNPDLVWVKGRSNAGANVLADSVRGSDKNLYSNLTDAETNPTTGASGGGIGTVTTDGFVLEQGTVNMDLVNTNTRTYVAWNWKANGAGSSNSNGTAKSSSVTVNSGTDTVTWNSHGMSDGQKIGFFATTMPGGLSAGTLYYVRDAATNTFKVAASSGGAAIDITSNGTSVTCHTTLTSTVSASATSGFSIVTYTGSGANATVEHGLGVAPSMIIVKNRDQAIAGGDTQNWFVYHSSIGATGQLTLNTTGTVVTNSEYWNNTAPSGTVFSLGNGNRTNFTGDDYVAYCFAPVDGYSAFGSYVGNGSTDGPFVYTGFRPRYILVKRTDSADNWAVYDTARDEYNQATKQLRPDAATAQLDPAGIPAVYYDLLSNGFKNRGSNSQCNASGGTYIYAAFAESPFKYSLAR